METTQKLTRRWTHIRIGLRTLLLLILILCGWLGLIVHRARVQRKAVAAIRKAGVLVYYDWECKDGKPIYLETGKPWAPGWLVEALGVDYFGRVVAVDFQGLKTTTDAIVARSRVQHKYLDDALETKAKMRREHEGRLDHKGRFDEALKARLDEAAAFSAAMDRMDAALAVLDKLDAMRRRPRLMDLEGHLGRLDGLQRLNLRFAGVCDADLARLYRLSRLRYLVLCGTKVTDAGLSHLIRITPGIESLDLSETGIGDGGLEHLRQFTTLKQLDLRETKVSDAGVARLRHVLPGLTVIR